MLPACSACNYNNRTVLDTLLKWVIGGFFEDTLWSLCHSVLNNYGNWEVCDLRYLLRMKVPLPVRLFPSILSTWRLQLALTDLSSRVRVCSSRPQ